MSKWRDYRLTLGNRQYYVGLAVAIILVLLGCAAIAYALATQISAPPTVSSGTIMVNKSGISSSQQPNGPTLGYARPVSIRIPAIGVKSSLIEVGKNPDGTIQVPEPPHINDAAWYKNSPAPGQYGASIIEGHIDNRYTSESVFFNLAQLAPGDKIFVKRADGLTAVFTATAVRLYMKNDFPTDVFYTTNGNDDAELHLITCGGTFNYQTDKYLSNTAVFSKLTSVKMPGSSVKLT